MMCICISLRPMKTLVLFNHEDGSVEFSAAVEVTAEGLRSLLDHGRIVKRGRRARDYDIARFRVECLTCEPGSHGIEGQCGEKVQIFEGLQALSKFLNYSESTVRTLVRARPTFRQSDGTFHRCEIRRHMVCNQTDWEIRKAWEAARMKKIAVLPLESPLPRATPPGPSD